MDTARTEHSEAPEELAHHFVLLHYECGHMDTFRLSGPPENTAQIAAWLCRVSAHQGVAASTYAAAEQAWPPTDAMDIAEDVAKDEEPF